MQPRLVIAAVLALGAVACGSSPPASPTSPAPIPATQVCDVLGNLNSSPAAGLAILSGTECSAQNSPVVKVNLRAANSSAGSCSGTIIAPRAVLTAAHCLDGDDIETVRIWTGVAGQPEVEAASYFYYPGFVFNGSGYDVGVVLMNEDLPRAPASILTSRPGVVGEAAIIAGFGKSDTSETSRLRAGSTNLSSVTQSYLQTPYAPPSSSICQGDSGGPIFLKQGTSWAIAGISSATSESACNTGENFYLPVAHPAVRAFILQHVPGVVER